jgi:AcrR family transcriptional regulator
MFIMTARWARALGAKADRAVLRQHLIEVTERLLVECGPDELTTRRIAREAGVAGGLLYNHFEDKDELILHGLVARATVLMRQFRDACPTPGTATVEANLERLAIAMFELQRAVLPLIVGLLGNRALLERFLAAVHAPEIGGPNAVLRRVHEYLDEERRLGRLRDGSEDHVAGVLLFAISQLQATVTQLRPADAVDARPELRPFTDFLAAALTNPSPAAPDDEQRSDP